MLQAKLFKHGKRDDLLQYGRFLFSVHAQSKKQDFALQSHFGDKNK